MWVEQVPDTESLTTVQDRGTTSESKAPKQLAILKEEQLAKGTESQSKLASPRLNSPRDASHPRRESDSGMTQLPLGRPEPARKRMPEWITKKRQPRRRSTEDHRHRPEDTSDTLDLRHQPTHSKAAPRTEEHMV